MRTFIALDINNDVKQTANDTISKLMRMGFKASWVKPENMHLTLFFLGDVRESLIDNMAEHLNKRLAGFPSFSIEISGFGYFRFRNRPRVVFLKVVPSKALQTLYLEMRSELKKLKIPFDDQGNFVPHITLGRVKESPEKWENLLKGITVPKILVAVDSFTIYSSTLTPRGPIYNWIYRSKFEGGLMKNER
ncbi:RNA 2',3'-cyclic phosphodiesterase [Thermosipho ferrireducens]|uniref:RNA 2',3'-cyclic phosphodiesterase n=1 Tax=Thermosipho ferrireducens TaxID=2571116 RepID=A0ABX7S9T4_9BACT|nr:RNA 2',3'-cyclic phosphodiesterase [Thermosipho ferrireducens]QTA38148.1 RNA 2',3'-cyclic phosphodiesterase [Thermosipho ferrireducens]